MLRSFRCAEIFLKIENETVRKNPRRGVDCVDKEASKP